MLSYFVVSTAPVDGLALLGAKGYAGIIILNWIADGFVTLTGRSVFSSDTIAVKNRNSHLRWDWSLTLLVKQDLELHRTLPISAENKEIQALLTSHLCLSFSSSRNHPESVSRGGHYLLCSHVRRGHFDGERNGCLDTRVEGTAVGWGRSVCTLCCPADNVSVILVITYLVV